MKKAALLLALLFILFTESLAVDISHDGRVLVMEPGDQQIKWITLLNTGELPEWLNIKISNINPVQLKESKEIFFKDGSARGWTYLREKKLKIAAAHQKKLPVEFSPPWNLAKGEYGIWLIMEQKKSVKKSGEEQRGRQLTVENVDMLCIPIKIKIQ
jgi:hypothetical protein